MSAEVAELRVRAARGMLKGVQRAGEDLLGRAQRLAPVEEGTLRASAALVLVVNGVRFEGANAYAAASAAVTSLARDGQRFSVHAEVSFNTVYAARQHEELEWEHPLAGQAKYLEQPLREQADRYSRVIALSAAAGA